jgi:hypothetical protein
MECKIKPHLFPPGQTQPWPLIGQATAAAPATDVHRPSGGGGPGHGLDGEQWFSSPGSSSRNHSSGAEAD